MLKVYSILYRILLALFVVLMFAAQMVVGTAGHNQDWSFTDYLPLIYSILTFVTLWVYAETDRGHTKEILRYANILLVGTGVAVLFYIITMSIVNDAFVIGLFIAELLIVWLGIMLMYSLIKDNL